MSPAMPNSARSTATPGSAAEAELCALLKVVDINAKPYVQLHLLNSELYQRRATR